MHGWNIKSCWLWKAKKHFFHPKQGKNVPSKTKMECSSHFSEILSSKVVGDVFNCESSSSTLSQKIEVPKLELLLPNDQISLLQPKLEAFYRNQSFWVISRVDIGFGNCIFHKWFWVSVKAFRNCFKVIIRLDKI